MLWLTAAVFGLSYGAAVIVEETKANDFSREELTRLQLSIGINHAMIEDPALFLSLGIAPLWLWAPRLVAAIIAIYMFHFATFVRRVNAQRTCHKNFAIIDDIRISFSKGFSVLTGETGAGKSIIIEAVNLLLGGRAASDLVRTGEKSAELEATFEIPPGSPAALIMAEQDMDPAEGLMIRRIIAASGKHKVYINSRQSTMQLLKQVTRNLAGISSQHAHQSLFNEENHLSILDHFAGTQTLAVEARNLYNDLNPLVRQIHELRTGADHMEQENDFYDSRSKKSRQPASGRARMNISRTNGFA